MLTRDQSRLLAQTIHKAMRGDAISIFDLSKIKSAFAELKSEPWFRSRALEIVGTLDTNVATDLRADIAAGKV
jgi:hypothetical protein